MTEAEALEKRNKYDKVLSYVRRARSDERVLGGLSRDTCDLKEQCHARLTLGIGFINYTFYIDGPAYIQRIYEIIKQAVGTETLNANNLLEGLDK